VKILIAFGVLAFLAGCSPRPMTETIYVVPPPVEMLADEPRHPVKAVSPPVAAVVRSKDTLVTEASRYVAGRQAKPPVILKLAQLTADASTAVGVLQSERNPRRRAVALAAARAKVTALADYLQNTAH
jgi:hypothetical protein